MRPLLATLLATTFLSCGPQGPVSRCSPAAAPAARPSVPVVFVAEPQELELLLPPAVFCQGGNPIATSVTTDVVDAQNQSVAHEHTDAVSSDTRGYSTTVRFTPLRRGVYLVTARFEPALGVAQRLVQVVGDRTAERPTLRVTVPGGCDDAVGFPGHALCRRAGVVTLWAADGGASWTAPSAGVLSAGRVGWSWGDGGVTRFLELDGGVVISSTPQQLAAGARAATQDLLITADDTQVTEVVATQPGLTVRAWPHDAGQVVGASLARAGDVLGLATPGRLCALAADGGRHCVDSPLEVGAADGNALWARGAETGVVAVARFSPAVQEPAVLFLSGQSVALSDTKQPRPAFTWNGRLVTVRADDLSLEAWQAPGAAARTWVTPAHVIFQLPGPELVLFTR